MTTTADSTTYGSISNAPGKREENQQRNKVHTTANVSDGTTTTTTVAASYGSAATVLAANQTVDAAEAAIRVVRRARTNPTALRTAKVTGTATRFETGHVATVSGQTNGSGYTPGTYNNIALVGGSGTGATANIVVAAGGSVTATATISRGGQWYLVGDVLTCNLIGPGSAFSMTVATITRG
jgi:hypothetical protein